MKTFCLVLATLNVKGVIGFRVAVKTGFRLRLRVRVSAGMFKLSHKRPDCVCVNQADSITCCIGLDVLCVFFGLWENTRGQNYEF